MALDIHAVYTRFATAVNAAQLPGETLKVTAYAYAPDAPSPPCFHGAEFDGLYDKTFGGLMEITTTWRLLLSRQDEETGQREAQRLAGTGQNTVFAALRSARPAIRSEGVCDDFHLRRVTGPRIYDYGSDGHFYGLEFTIFVMG